MSNRARLKTDVCQHRLVKKTYSQDRRLEVNIHLSKWVGAHKILFLHIQRVWMIVFFQHFSPSRAKKERARERQTETEREINGNLRPSGSNNR